MTTTEKPLDPGRIELSRPHEVAWWCRELGCTEERLRDVVARVGEHVTAVREALDGDRDARAADRPLDPGRIDVNSPHEIAWWTLELGCTEAQLRDVVGRVGEHSTAVRDALAGRRH